MKTIQFPKKKNVDRLVEELIKNVHDKVMECYEDGKFHKEKADRMFNWEEDD